MKVFVPSQGQPVHLAPVVTSLGSESLIIGLATADVRRARDLCFPVEENLPEYSKLSRETVKAARKAFGEDAEKMLGFAQHLAESERVEVLPGHVRIIGEFVQDGSLQLLNVLTSAAIGQDEGTPRLVSVRQLSQIKASIDETVHTANIDEITDTFNILKQVGKDSLKGQAVLPIVRTLAEVCSTHGEASGPVMQLIQQRSLLQKRAMTPEEIDTLSSDLRSIRTRGDFSREAVYAAILETEKVEKKQLAPAALAAYGKRLASVFTRAKIEESVTDDVVEQLTGSVCAVIRAQKRALTPRQIEIFATAIPHDAVGAAVVFGQTASKIVSSKGSITNKRLSDLATFYATTRRNVSDADAMLVALEKANKGPLSSAQMDRMGRFHSQLCAADDVKRERRMKPLPRAMSRIPEWAKDLGAVPTASQTEWLLDVVRGARENQDLIVDALFKAPHTRRKELGELYLTAGRNDFHTLEGLIGMVERREHILHKAERDCFRRILGMRSHMFGDGSSFLSVINGLENARGTLFQQNGLDTFARISEAGWNGLHVLGVITKIQNVQLEAKRWISDPELALFADTLIEAAARAGNSASDTLNSLNDFCGAYGKRVNPAIVSIVAAHANVLGSIGHHYVKAVSRFYLIAKPAEDAAIANLAAAFVPFRDESVRLSRREIAAESFMKVLAVEPDDKSFEWGHALAERVARLMVMLEHRYWISDTAAQPITGLMTEGEDKPLMMRAAERYLTELVELGEKRKIANGINALWRVQRESRDEGVQLAPNDCLDAATEMCRFAEERGVSVARVKFKFGA